jgi:purine-binding chemotaxis protein CheW
LFLRVGARLCALPLACVVETSRPLPIESLPGTAPFVSGLTVFRGEAMPVVDARVLLGLPADREPGRFVSLALDARRLVLAVDAVIGVRSIDDASLAALPPLAGEIAATLVSAIAALESGLLLFVRSARLVPEETWAVLEARS